jgi:hypothetical protein
MLHETLAQYLAGVEQAILRCSNAYVERYTEEILTPQRANLRIRLRFEQGHLLEINETVVVVEDSLVPLDYRYHCDEPGAESGFRAAQTISMAMTTRGLRLNRLNTSPMRFIQPYF